MDVPPIFHCDRLSGRSRIGTSSITVENRALGIAIVFRGDRGLEQVQRVLLRGRDRIAIVFRGDRGLEPDYSPLRVVIQIAIVFRGDRGLEPWCRYAAQNYNDYCDRLSGRSRIGTSLVLRRNRSGLIAIVFRGDRGLEQDLQCYRPLIPLRSSFGAIEDWNSLHFINS